MLYARRPKPQYEPPAATPAVLIPNNAQSPGSPVAVGAVSLCHACSDPLDEDLLCPKCDYAPEFRPHTGGSVAEEAGAGADDPSVFVGPEHECCHCRFRYADSRALCPKCEYGRFEQNASRYLPVDVAHRHQTVPQATQQCLRALDLAHEQRYAGILYISGRGRISAEVQGLLHFLWAKGRILSYAPMENNPGSWLVRLPAEPPADTDDFIPEFWAEASPAPPQAETPAPGPRRR